MLKNASMRWCGRERSEKALQQNGRDLRLETVKGASKMEETEEQVMYISESNVSRRASPSLGSIRGANIAGSRAGVSTSRSTIITLFEKAAGAGAVIDEGARFVTSKEY